MLPGFPSGFLLASSATPINLAGGFETGLDGFTTWAGSRYPGFSYAGSYALQVPVGQSAWISGTADGALSLSASLYGRSQSTFQHGFDLILGIQTSPGSYTSRTYFSGSIDANYVSRSVGPVTFQGGETWVFQFDNNTSEVCYLDQFTVTGVPL